MLEVNGSKFIQAYLSITTNTHTREYDKRYAWEYKVKRKMRKDNMCVALPALCAVRQNKQTKKQKTRKKKKKKI
jgi:hypothetical protein